jgi:hypothetical protein
MLRNKAGHCFEHLLPFQFDDLSSAILAPSEGRTSSQVRLRVLRSMCSSGEPYASSSWRFLWTDKPAAESLKKGWPAQQGSSSSSSSSCYRSLGLDPACRMHGTVHRCY